MGKGQKRAKAKAGKGGTEEAAPEVRLGEDPHPAGLIAGEGAFPRPQPRSQAEALEVGVCCSLPLPSAYTETPPQPYPRARTRWLSVSVLPVCHVYQMYTCLHVCMLGSTCLRSSAARTPDCPKSQSQPGY